MQRNYYTRKNELLGLMDKLRHQKALHTKYVLKRERDEVCQVRKNRARVMKCGTEEQHDDKTFSPVVYSTIVKLINCLAVRRR